METIFALVMFALGFAAGWFSRSIPEPEAPMSVPRSLMAPPSAEPVNGNAPDRVYVRFQFADGHVEVKKFLVSDLDTRIGWRGRTFAIGEWTADGHIYREVVGRAWQTE